MKKKMNTLNPFKALLLAGLLAAPILAFNAKAADNVWSPTDVFTDGSGNPYAYWNDPFNWSLLEVPALTYSGDGSNERVVINGTVGAYVPCLLTNSTAMYQLIMGDSSSGAGILIITNGASVTAGFVDGQYTGIGFPNGPATLMIETNSSFAIGSHLWVGQGTNNPAPAQGTVIVDGGTLNIPSGQLGVGWNGIGGTNFITFTNGGKLFLDTWASQTLGKPGNNSLGIMNLADNASRVVVTNNQTGFFNTLVTNSQLIAYGGQGKVTWSYNPVQNVTTLIGLAPPNQYTPVIVSQPTNVVSKLGGTASFHVEIDNVPVTYQWMFNGNNLTDGGGISGSQTATLTISGITSANIGNYSIVATNTTHLDQYTTSDTAALSTTGINLYPVITILGVPGDTYVTSYATTVNGTYIPFATNTVSSFAPFYLVDTNTPMSVTRFYSTHQQ